MVTDRTYLAHHGIKGQKWGIRRYQNEDGSLTPEGRERYASEKSYTAALFRNNLANGMSEKDAIAAARRQRDTTRLLVAAGVAVLGAGAAYAFIKYKNTAYDSVIKAGEEIQRMDSDSSSELYDIFYGSHNKMDNLLYNATMPQFNRAKGNDSYKKILTPIRDIKIAGNRTAAKVFKDLYKNDEEFREEWNSDAKENRAQALLLMKQYDARASSYKYFARLAPMLYGNSGIAKKYFDRLKSLGYNGVVDANDSSFGGYGSKHPVIFFNPGSATKNNYNVLSIEEYSRAPIKDLVKGGAIFAGRQFINDPSLYLMASGALLAKAYNKTNSAKIRDKVNKLKANKSKGATKKNG